MPEFKITESCFHSSTATAIFRNKLKSPNFMTPGVLEYFKYANGLVIELSEGKGFTQDKIIGVTVLWWNKETLVVEHMEDLNKLFSDRESAEAYIQELVSKELRTNSVSGEEIGYNDRLINPENIYTEEGGAING